MIIIFVSQNIKETIEQSSQTQHFSLTRSYHEIGLGGQHVNLFRNMVNVLKFRTLYSFYSQIKMVFKARNLRMLIRLANGKDPDLGLPCVSMPFWLATSV